ncbi:helix-turn-helix domain-containing protein [Chitinophaga sancti]|uniref:AraC family transcriptional regulator n=1 Tax=Chitinophaga sancti TaxID=1004 RepID=A0A1K1RXM3_9BACT|nr:AraC family transcriptional regulator [Chitinophaga sancti]WQD64046.1 AraC family transcriptional regulator [Chitinophaga sancti]WQG90330.1 AraC family transcriptional regulator [Chitinophaga sancti]SFW76706.1 AraC-type DNA-binding protein [Chitinophaga sancti]
MKQRPPALEQMELLALKALCFADDHVSESFEMKHVSDWLGISYSYFYHSFTHVIGEPYWQYVKRHRLELSAGLLRHSGYNISEIAERSGYATVAAFTKAFTQYFDQSPRGFRKIPTLPNEQRTLQLVDSIIKAFDKKGDTLTAYFNFERTELTYLPESMLYYTILSRGQDPVVQMIMKMTREEIRLRKILQIQDLPQAKVITSTLDAVPVTSYEQMSMFAGIFLPCKDVTMGLMTMARTENLMEKRIPAGHYIKLPVPMDFAMAGIPMYEFIDRYVKEGVFKMSGNHFFISMVGPNESEIYIPYLKQLL